MRRALLLGAAVLLAAVDARAQISPGPLSRFHQPLEGARNCRTCHATEGVTRDLCLTCHTALARRIAAGQGLHARPEYRAGCERCHVEHQGRAFDLVFWGQQGRASFDHAQTGFALEGRHGALACESCHDASRIRDRAGLARGGVNLKRTFLGLTSECASCHADPHRKQFAPRACTDCHDARQWKPARFDHDRSGFPLTGAHEAVPCASCHQATTPGGAVRFKGTPHLGCASCHADPHAGRMGTRCDSCHSTASWSRIEAGRFDHSRTRFPLTGLHQQVACASCHARGGRTRYAGTPFQTCASCHQDPHAGRLGTGCATCHSSTGWRVESGAFDHDRARFPLKGRHASVACDSCHPPGRPRAMAHAACTDCHADRHAGQLADRPDRGRCETCHDVAGWSPARFSIDDHARTRLPLTGAHLAVPCDACHREVATETLRGVRPPPGWPTRTERFDFAGSSCAGCHPDPHGGHFARSGPTDCARCHDPAAWRPARFDHDRETAFPLQGAHRSVPCAGCHLRETDGRRVPLYSGIGKACSDCHGADR